MSLFERVSKRLRGLPRFTVMALVTAILLLIIAAFVPEKIGMDIHKITTYTLGVMSGFWADVCVFPYSQPSSYLKTINWRGEEARTNRADFEIADGYQVIFAVVIIRRCMMIGFAVWLFAMGM